jgi:hypothetical protein
VSGKKRTPAPSEVEIERVKAAIKADLESGKVSLDELRRRAPDYGDASTFKLALARIVAEAAPGDSSKTLDARQPAEMAGKATEDIRAATSAMKALDALTKHADTIDVDAAARGLAARHAVNVLGQIERCIDWLGTLADAIEVEPVEPPSPSTDTGLKKRKGKRSTPTTD